MLLPLLYQKPDMSLWQGRADGYPDEYFYQITKPLDLHAIKKVKPGIALLGFASDIGVARNLGRPGAKEGPYAIKRALAKLPVQHDLQHLYDAGTITAEGDNLESSQSALAEAIHLLLQQGFLPVVLGGGHEMAWGHYQGIAHWLGNKSLSIVNFDAHFDLRETQQGTSGTPFRQIALARKEKELPFDYTCIGIQPYSNTRNLFKVAHSLNTRYLTAEQIHQNAATIEQFIAPLLQQDQGIYLTICLDVFSINHAPGVSAPQALGLMPWQVLPALRLLALSGKIVSFDIAEMAPCFDRDGQTSKLAAVLLSDFLHCLNVLGRK